MAAAGYPMQAALHQPQNAPEDLAKKPLPAKSFVLVVGTLLVCLVVALPLWNSTRLIREPTFMFFIGATWPLWCIGVCLVAVVIFPLAVQTVFYKLGPQASKDYPLLLVVSTVTSAIGLGLLLISAPILDESNQAYNNLITNCAFSTSTRGLYEEATVLQKMRGSTECAALESVEECEGFARNQYTSFLKQMESQYMCSGFCFGSGYTMDPHVVGIGVTNTSLLQAGDLPAHHPAAAMIQTAVGEKVYGKFSKGVRRLFTDVHGEDGKAEQVEAQVIKEAEPELGRRVFQNPPTLFSKANYQASCDGMAAWELKFSAGIIASYYYIQGACLLFATAIIGFLKSLKESTRGMWFDPEYAEGIAYKQRMQQAAM